MLEDRKIKAVKIVVLYKKLYLFIKSLKSKKKKLAQNFVLLCHSRNMVGQFKKANLRRPIKILQFLILARTQKCFAELQNILAFLKINHLESESRILQGIFLHVILLRIIVPWYCSALTIAGAKKAHLERSFVMN